MAMPDKICGIAFLGRGFAKAVLTATSSRVEIYADDVGSIVIEDSAEAPDGWDWLCERCETRLRYGHEVEEHCRNWAEVYAGDAVIDWIKSAKPLVAAAETGAATVNAVTDDQIRALLQRAVADWDCDLAITCQAALDGSEIHRAECLQVIAATSGADEGSS